MAVVAPMPSASASTVNVVKTGVLIARRNV
jgi:hypothetical protein